MRKSKQKEVKCRIKEKYLGKQKKSKVKIDKRGKQRERKRLRKIIKTKYKILGVTTDAMTEDKRKKKPFKWENKTK